MSERNSQHSFPILVDRLKQILHERHISEMDLAAATQLPYMTIHRIVSGATRDPRISTLQILAKYLEVPLDQLLDEDRTVVSGTFRGNKSIFIPVLDWEIAAKFEEMDLTKIIKWQSVTVSASTSLSARAFALESLPSQQPRFPERTIFVIDPLMPPVDGDIVLVKIQKTQELFIRELSIDPPEHSLRSLIPGKATIPLNPQEHVILGVVFLTILYNRRIPNCLSLT